MFTQCLGHIENKTHRVYNEMLLPHMARRSDGRQKAVRKILNYFSEVLR